MLAWICERASFRGRACKAYEILRGHSDRESLAASSMHQTTRSATRGLQYCRPAEPCNVSDLLSNLTGWYDHGECKNLRESRVQRFLAGPEAYKLKMGSCFALCFFSAVFGIRRTLSLTQAKRQQTPLCSQTA